METVSDICPPLSDMEITTNGRMYLANVSLEEDRSEYDCVFLRPGHVDAADGTKSNWLIPAEVAEQAAPMFEGVAVYLDHPEMFGFGIRGEPQVKNLAGVTTGAMWDGTQIVGSIRLYDEDPNSPGVFVRHILDAMLADKEADKPVPAVGLSAVFYHEAELDEDTGNKITRQFKKVESVDVVYSPGAGGYVRQALAAMPQPASPPPDGGDRGGAKTTTPNDKWYTVGDPTSHPHRERSKTPMSQERLITMTVDEPEEAAPESELSALSAQVAELTANVNQMHEDMVELSGDPPVSEDQHHATLEDLHAHVQHLSQVLAQNERPIQGMGNAAADGRAMLPARFSITDPLKELQNAWDWLFGVDDAKMPSPELRRTDYLYRLLSGDLNWTGVFNEREALAAASTTTLADMAVNAMNKVIVPLYNRLDVYRWYEQIVTVQPTDGTLHDMAWLQFGGIGDLPVVAEGAAYTELTVGDTKESDSFTKYGGYVGITDKVLRNSDIARLQAVPRALTISAVQTRSAKIAEIFSSNSGVGPTLDQDSVALFHTASHSNLATTAFSWTAWKAARIECAKHAELTSSKRTGFFPRYCLVPVDLYDEALQAFGYGQGTGGEPGTANNDVNPFGVGRPGDPRPIPIMVPDWTDTNDWAYVVDPVIAPVIQMAYADSPGGRVHPAPQLFSVTSPTAGLMFTNDVLPIKVRDYFAYGVATYRGIGKRNVT